MPEIPAEIPDVNVIAQQVKARIEHIEEQLQQHQKLTDELERLRGALSRLEGDGRSRVRAARDRKPAVKSAGSGTRRVKPAGAPTRAPRGQNKAEVLDALRYGPMTASEIANTTGIGTGTVSTMLAKMAKSGELAKAERGYRLPQ
jgi:predicted Rossmann fold nucleotide-binding protein DprA/Smf involved in DNA uptake